MAAQQREDIASIQMIGEWHLGLNVRRPGCEVLVFGHSKSPFDSAEECHNPLDASLVKVS
jgi:hypothetical protein